MTRKVKDNYKQAITAMKSARPMDYEIKYEKKKKTNTHASPRKT